MYQIHRARSILLFVGSLTFCLVTNAQNPAGSLRGYVQDASGARLAHAQVTARASESASERQATADDRGEFRLNNLLP
jgi:hypothetical protein